MAKKIKQTNKQKTPNNLDKAHRDEGHYLCHRFQSIYRSADVRKHTQAATGA